MMVPGISLLRKSHFVLMLFVIIMPLAECRQDLELQTMDYEFDEDGEGGSMPALAECAGDIADCLKEDGKWILTENSSFPETFPELEDACRYGKMIFDCLDLKVPLCVNNMAYVIGYSMVVEGPKDIIRELCEAGNLRNDYLKYSSCYKPLIPNENKCAISYRTLLQDMKDLLSDAGRTTEPMGRMCRSKDALYDCLSEKSKEDCLPEGAAILIRIIAPFLADPLISHFCLSNFPPERKKTSTTSTTTTTERPLEDITYNELPSAGNSLTLTSGMQSTCVLTSVISIISHYEMLMQLIMPPN